MKTLVWKQKYSSRLGDFELLATTSNTLFKIEINDGSIHTVGYDIHIQCIGFPLDNLADFISVETATAWMFYITKRNSSKEQLGISMSLLSEDAAVQIGAETGENLIAVGFENSFRQVHLGTEDEDAMAQRAKANDWLPPRFEKMLRTSLQAEAAIQLTTITPHGLCTQIPQMEIGEKFYFHYIIAENPVRPAVDYPDEMDISTWFVVNQTKNKLEEYWQVYKEQPGS